MKKTLSSLLLLLFISVVSEANYLVKLEFQYRLWDGHGVEMYYSVQNLNELSNKILAIDTITERRVLETIGIPLDGDNKSQENCTVPLNIKVDYDELFKGRRKKIITYNSDVVELKMEIIKCNYNLCVFPIYVKYWASYNVSFKEAAVITSIPQKISMSKKEEETLEILQRCIKKLKSPAHGGY